MKPLPLFSRAAAFAILLAAWAAIYLPGLGSLEIRGEEVRRIMPGVTMLQTGDWIVPRFNGEPYLRKPPLVNWAIALSIKALRARNEWTARLPSVLAILAMALVMLAVCESWLGANAALAAVLITLTSAGIVEKGRLAEIEAIYISLFGIAFSCWLAWSATGRSRWLIWTVTGFFLGLGLLAKGPPHLAFFYAIAFFIAWKSWRKKDAAAAFDTGLASWAHLCGIIVMLGLFAIWCIPYMRQSSTLGAGGVWARQIEQRIGEGDSGTIFSNLLRSLVNFLPWALALPLFWRRATLAKLTPRERLLVEAARWPIVICAFALMLIPGMLPRYTLPLVIPYALLLALLLKAEMAGDALRWPLAAACVVSAGMLVFGLFVAPRIPSPARNFAARINSLMPPGSPIYIFNPSIQPEIFYINGRLLYTGSVKDLPDNVPWLLAPDEKAKIVRLRGIYRQSTVLAQLTDEHGRPFVFLSLQSRVRKGQGPMDTAPPADVPKK